MQEARRTNRSLVTVGLLFALFVGALDTTVVSTAMPHIMGELKGLALVSWIFTIYTLATCVTTPIFGKLADLFGRKSVFVWGLALFVLGSILCGAAQTMPQLIIFRAIQGIGAGALTPVTFTIIGDLYPGEQRGRVQGVFASVWSVAALLGPLVGGYFVDVVTWRWIFYMNVPVGIIAFGLVVGALHEPFEKKTKSIDYAGALTFTIGITALLYALLSGGIHYSWSSGVEIGLLVLALVFLLAFIGIEKRAPEPMLPLDLFRSRRMTLLYVMAFLAFCVVSGVSIYIPMWIQTLLGRSATSSGLTLMPMSLAWPFAANLSGRLMYRLGPKTFVVTGAAFVAGGSLWLAFVSTASPYWFLAGVLILIGFGMGCMTTPAMVLIQTSVTASRRGVATSTNSLMNAFGQTVGVAVFGALFNRYATDHAPEQLATGIHMVFLLLVGIALVNLLAVSLLPSAQSGGQEETSR
ncbi:MDR family MFS transporter [Paenibacillus aurantius]|uniref:MDR family MFS transporter n=1 Tax=Paenibacillus aurantius TaxID=2918900 RepID=A0AA96RIX3_9BACL|nr:MDR family MFS transporter [Paenibacillus aurantius]WNQ12644.1 MDR family MFS transporter [Paenibacillus aurantius]